VKIRFFLKRPKSKKETALFAIISYEGQELKIYTGESIIPRFWNKKGNLARNSPGFAEHMEFNERLSRIKSTTSAVFLAYKNRNGHAAPAPAVLKPLIEVALKKGVHKTTFLDYFEEFVTRSFNGQRLDPRSKMPIRKSVAKGYQTTLNNLKQFSKTWKRRLDFETVDLGFHHDFSKFLSDAPRMLSANTIGSNIQRIKAVMAEATEKGINNNKTFKSKYFVKQSEEADTIYLNESELNEMEKLDLSFSEKLDNVRDWFLVGARSGLRVSDFLKLRPQDINDGFIRIKQTKTGNPVTVPVHSTVKKILLKRGGEPPRVITDVKLNLYLKELGQYLPSLKTLVSKSITKGGTRVILSVPKWKLLTSHAARRSFCSNEFQQGTPTLTLMAISGHRSEKSFLKYIRVTPEEHAQKIRKLWDDREKRKRKNKLRIAK
jgi:integrase